MQALKIHPRDLTQKTIILLSGAIAANIDHAAATTGCPPWPAVSASRSGNFKAPMMRRATRPGPSMVSCAANWPGLVWLTSKARTGYVHVVNDEGRR